MAEEKKSEEQYYLPPPKLSKWEGFKVFMWNSERREFMGRTAASWGKVGLFYLIFYTGLAAFFAVMLLIFYQTLDNFAPKWQLDKSVIGTNPGLGFRPMPPESTSESTLIWFSHGQSSGSWHHYKKSLSDFLEDYEAGKQSAQHFKTCDNDVSGKQSCLVPIDYDNWAPCKLEDTYGYRDGTPCILIKMNRIYGWVPETYSMDEIPEDAKKRLSEEDIRKANSSDHVGIVWLTCEGENPADKENIGMIKYYPYPGFGARFFPYINVQKYLSPFVFVHFANIEKGVLVNIECKVWAKNIFNNRPERRGSVHFELMVD